MLPGSDQLGPVNVDPSANQPRFAELQASGENPTCRQVDDRPVFTMPGMDVGNAVVPDVHVDNDHMEGAQTAPSHRLQATTDDMGRDRPSVNCREPEGTPIEELVVLQG
jgi:hypothetical protein